MIQLIFTPVKSIKTKINNGLCKDQCETHRRINSLHLHSLEVAIA